jgi:hypothetical protein
MTSPLPPDTQSQLRKIFQLGLQQGCPKDQLLNFAHAGIVLQARQLAASAAARLCDLPDGPTAIGYGGARGGGKSHWLLAQMGADDCQRMPGLKCLLLRMVGKSNLEHLEGLRQRLFHLLPHDFNASRGILTFPNGSRIVLGHYQKERDIDSYLGLEYDVIGVEEATQLTLRKYEDLTTCCRTSKPGWRPRVYSTTNPGGIGHQWYFEKFIAPHQAGTESATRFITARVDDNAFINPEYRATLASRTGWQYAAWFQGCWDIAAGQYFKNLCPEVHVIGDEGLDQRFSSGDWLDLGRMVQPFSPAARAEYLDDLARLRRFRPSDAVEWIAAMDYGYTHLTAVLFACLDSAGNIYIMDEHAERYWIPQQHVQAIKAKLAQHHIYTSEDHLREVLRTRYPAGLSSEVEAQWHLGRRRMLSRFVAGEDMFNKESNGQSVAHQYRDLGITLRKAYMDRMSGWSAVLQRLGDPAAGIMPSLFIHHRCRRLIECLPCVQQDPDRPGDVLKSNINEEGVGGDDFADALRYLVATKPNIIRQVRLRGL